MTVSFQTCSETLAGNLSSKPLKNKQQQKENNTEFFTQESQLKKMFFFSRNYHIDGLLMSSVKEELPNISQEDFHKLHFTIYPG